MVLLKNAPTSAIVALTLSACISAPVAPPAASEVEAGAGSWTTWVLRSGSELRVPPPPDPIATAAEFQHLRSLADQRDAAMLDRIGFWDSGAPGYRWNGILADELSKHRLAGATTSRHAALMQVAIYDATIAAWHSKYTYRRARPSAADPSLVAVVATPHSPSYPSEHAAVAAAAAGVLAYLFPDDAGALMARALEAARSRESAGVQYPSDTVAGLWSMWQLSYRRRPGQESIERPLSNLFFLPATSGQRVEGGAVEDVLFMRDEMANLAWAIERVIESALERPMPRLEYDTQSVDEAATDAAQPSQAPPRYRLSSRVPVNWIPLLPLQTRTPDGKVISRLRRGAVLQPDGTQRLHRAMSDALASSAELLLFDEEVPREGQHLTRRRVVARWIDGTTCLWTAFRKEIGRGEGSSGLVFDRLDGDAAHGS